VFVVLLITPGGNEGDEAPQVNVNDGVNDGVPEVAPARVDEPQGQDNL